MTRRPLDALRIAMSSCAVPSGAVLLSLLSAGGCLPLAAQGELQPVAAPTVQPSACDLGTLAVGATVESSFAVFWADAGLAKSKARIELPSDCRLLRMDTSEYNGRALTEVEFELTTAAARDIDTTFVVHCGSEVARVPLRASVVAMPAGGSRILVAESPFGAFSAEDPATFDAWRKIVAQGRLEVDYRLLRRDRQTFDVEALRRVDVVLAGAGALTSLDAEQVARLHGFVCGGGRLVVFANAFFGQSVRAANRLCEPFGLRILDEELQGGGTFTTDVTGMGKHPLTVGVEELSVLRPSPVEVLDERVAVQLVGFGTPKIQGFAAIAATRGAGELIAVGDSLWWSSCGKSSGYARLLRNLLTRPPRLR
jgi:hypothetical protein